MHEMPVTQALLSMALENADGQRITDIHLEVGEVSPVVPASVELFFDYLSKDTLAEGARLHFQPIPLEMTCQDCGRRADLSEWAGERGQFIMVQALTRGCACGSRNLRVTDGVSFGLVSIEVEEAPR